MAKPFTLIAVALLLAGCTGGESSASFDLPELERRIEQDYNNRHGAPDNWAIDVYCQMETAPGRWKCDIEIDQPADPEAHTSYEGYTATCKDKYDVDSCVWGPR